MTPLKFLLILFVIYILAEAIFLWHRANVSKQIIQENKIFENLSTNYSKKFLILGDSTGVGIGATSPKDSVTGLLSEQISATYTENDSVSGAEIKDLPGQLQARKLKNTLEDNYDLILIQIGGNDIIRFHNVADQKIIFQNFLKTLPPYKKLIVISVGNVGDSTLFPFFIRPFHTKLSLKYHAMFEQIVPNSPNATYVNLYEPDKNKNLFLLHPEIYLSGDGLHPSSAGYKLWFEKILEITKL